MGAWNAGLWSDDTALDLKGDWEELYKRFGEPEQATRELLEIHDADDEDVGPVVVLALAMCQWRYGCLQPEIEARALEILRTGAGLHMWEGAKDLARRKKVYVQVAATLEGPQPPRKRIKHLVPREVTSYERGQLLSYRCWDGEYLLLWVCALQKYKGDVLPLCAALDWKGRTLPDRRDILALRPVLSDTDRFTKRWMEEQAQKEGVQLPPALQGLEWTGYAPREPSKYGFDVSRVEVVPGEWHWDLRKREGGRQVPLWIEVGPTIARDLSTTVAVRDALPRKVGWPGSVELPKTPRPMVLAEGPSRTLGIDVVLPAGRATKHSHLLTLKRTRHDPVRGDIFVVNVQGKRWVLGRVILADAHFACGPADVLVYFYRQSFSTTREITLPMSLQDLALPPCAASPLDWESGHFFHVANVPIEACEVPARHIFGPDQRGWFVDAYGMPTLPPAEYEVVGTRSLGGIGRDLARVFGID